MNYCPNFKGVLKKTDKIENKKTVTVARCKMWSCKYCAEKNSKKWQAVILEFVNTSGLEWSWFTLTAHKNTHKHDKIVRSTYVNLRGSFSKLMKRIRRKFPNQTIAYVRIFEQHKSGALHIHCIISVSWDDIVTRNAGSKKAYKDSKWLRENFPECGGGYKTHCDNIDIKKSFFAAFYVTKYMTKTGSEETKNLSGIRRIQTRRHFVYNPKTEASDGWILSSGYYDDEFIEDLDQNMTVYNATEKRIFTSDDFLDGFVYPK